MTQCILTETPPYYCTVCDFGNGLDITEPFRKNCDNTPAAIERRKEQEAQVTEAAERLGVTLEHVRNYRDALLRWRQAGYPTRTAEEVATIYAEHCGPCDQLVGNRCRKCGCRVTAKGMAVLNKIKMATESCPDKKW